jgi:cytochrome c biogenesis protein CcmG/thiol:disulfide interchange protein DsbE
VSNRPSRQSSSAQRVREASQGGRRSMLWLWIGLAAVIVAVGIVAIAVGNSSSSGSDDGGSASPSGGTVVPNGDVEYGTVTVEGNDLPAAPSTGGSDSGVGEAIPTIEGESFDGSAITIAPGGGKGQVIMGVAHWCPHCQAEVPRIQEWLDEDGMPTDVNLVAVATANDPSRVNYPAGDWLRKEGWSVPTIVDDEEGTAAKAIGLSAFPFFVVVDADGKVVLRTSGELDRGQWDALLEAARTGQAESA